MPNLNRIILVGRLTADPEARSTVEGLPVTRFRLAVNRPNFGQGMNRDGSYQGEAAVDFIDVVAWRRLAEICGQYLKKGQLTLVDGRIQNRSFEDQTGQRRWVTEVVARTMTMLEKSQSPVVTHDEEAVADEELVDDSELAGDLPF